MRQLPKKISHLNHADKKHSFCDLVVDLKIGQRPNEWSVVHVYSIDRGEGKAAENDCGLQFNNFWNNK